MVTPPATVSADMIGPGDRGADLVQALLERSAHSAPRLLDQLRAHEVAPAAIDALVALWSPSVHGDPSWREAVERNRVAAARRVLVHSMTATALAGLVRQVAFTASALGPLWSHDVDVIVAPSALGAASDALRQAGFSDLDPLLDRLGRSSPGVSRFAAFHEREPLGYVELSSTLTDPGPPADEAIGRVRPTAAGRPPLLADQDRIIRRSVKIARARRATVRSALELRGLLDVLPNTPKNADVVVALRRCAALEQQFGVRSELSRVADKLPRLPNRRWPAARARAVRRQLRRRLQPRRVIVVFSGVDGAGKSLQAATLAQWLQRLGIPAAVVWTRLGYGSTRLLERAAAFAQSLLPAHSHSAMTARATGQGERNRATRRGALGWTWTLVVTLDYLWRMRRGVLRPRGFVVVCDRGLLDACVGLEVEFGGSLSLGLHRRLLNRLSPAADYIFYLRLPPDAAHGRKEDMFASAVLEYHRETYERFLIDAPKVVALDALRPPRQLSDAVLKSVLGAAG